MPRITTVELNINIPADVSEFEIVTFSRVNMVVKITRAAGKDTDGERFLSNVLFLIVTSIEYNDSIPIPE